MSTADPSSDWTPITEQEAKDWRRRAHDPKRLTRAGHRLEYNTAYHLVPQADEVDGNTGTIEAEGRGPVRPKDPRKVVEEVYGMIYEWATSDPQAYQKAVAVMRRHYPDSFGHLTDEELVDKLRDYAEMAAKEAGERAYREAGWDRGHILDWKHIK